MVSQVVEDAFHVFHVLLFCHNSTHSLSHLLHALSLSSTLLLHFAELLLDFAWFWISKPHHTPCGFPYKKRFNQNIFFAHPKRERARFFVPTFTKSLRDLENLHDVLIGDHLRLLGDPLLVLDVFQSRDERVKTRRVEAPSHLKKTKMLQK